MGGAYSPSYCEQAIKRALTGRELGPHVLGRSKGIKMLPVIGKETLF